MRCSAPRYLPGLFVILTLCVSLSHAQPSSRAEVFGGYSYVNIDTNGLTSRQSMNGWEAGASFDIVKWLAAEGDVGGYYKNNVLNSGVNARDYEFAGGPRINYHPVFVHALFGVDHLSGNGFGISGSQDSFAMLLGGGVEVKVAPHWAMRTSFDYAGTHHNLFSHASELQNNFRVGGGIAYIIGTSERQRVANRNSSPEQRGCVVATGAPRPVTLEQVGLSGDGQTPYGFRILAIVPGSPAAKAELAVGDYIVTANCINVRTPAELAAALSRGGDVSVLTINKPYWNSNQTIERRLSPN